MKTKIRDFFIHHHEYSAKEFLLTRKEDTKATQIKHSIFPYKCVNSIDGATFSVTPPIEFTRYRKSLVKSKESTKSRVNARIITSYNVKSTGGVTEKVAPSVDFTHYHDYLAKN